MRESSRKKDRSAYSAGPKACKLEDEGHTKRSNSSEVRDRHAYYAASSHSKGKQLESKLDWECGQLPITPHCTHSNLHPHPPRTSWQLRLEARMRTTPSAATPTPSAPTPTPCATLATSRPWPHLLHAGEGRLSWGWPSCPRLRHRRLCLPMPVASIPRRR